jgi:hypothetical protein
MAYDDITSQATTVPAQTPPAGNWTAGQYGVYSFTVSDVVGGTIPGLAAGTTFWSTCLSPGGELSSGSYTYNYETFAAANNGLNPSAWTSGNGQLWGIQNANYIWNSFASAALGLNGAAAHGLTTPSAGAALEMAMYVALYDSTGYGTYSDAAGSKFVPTGFDKDFMTALNDDLGVLNATAVAQNLASGYLLVPTDPSASGPSGQEFIFMAPFNDNVAAVPEPAPAGVLAGVVALLAVSGGVVRRKFLVRT